MIKRKELYYFSYKGHYGSIQLAVHCRSIDTCASTATAKTTIYVTEVSDYDFLSEDFGMKH